MGTNRNSRLFIIMVMGLFVISACQSLPFEMTEGSLNERIAGMMTARQDQNWAKVYEYLDPEYRSKVSKSSFVNMSRNIQYNNFTIESVEYTPSGKKATATVKYDFVVQALDVQDHRETQDWIKSSGQWYFKTTADTVMD